MVTDLTFRRKVGLGKVWWSWIIARVTVAVEFFVDA
jgi:hypothetical protein